MLYLLLLLIYPIQKNFEWLTGTMEAVAIQTNRTQIGFGTHLERKKPKGREKQAMENHFSLPSICQSCLGKSF